MSFSLGPFQSIIEALNDVLTCFDIKGFSLGPFQSIIEAW